MRRIEFETAILDSNIVSESYRHDGLEQLRLLLWTSVYLKSRYMAGDGDTRRTWKQENGEFKGILRYMLSSRPVWAT